MGAISIKRNLPFLQYRNSHCTLRWSPDYLNFIIGMSVHTDTVLNLILIFSYRIFNQPSGAFYVEVSEEDTSYGYTTLISDLVCRQAEDVMLLCFLCVCRRQMTSHVCMCVYSAIVNIEFYLKLDFHIKADCIIKEWCAKCLSGRNLNETK